MRAPSRLSSCNARPTTALSSHHITQCQAKCKNHPLMATQSTQRPPLRATVYSQYDSLFTYGSGRTLGRTKAQTLETNKLLRLHALCGARTVSGLYIRVAVSRWESDTSTRPRRDTDTDRATHRSPGKSRNGKRPRTLFVGLRLTASFKGVRSLAVQRTQWSLSTAF